MFLNENLGTLFIACIPPYGKFQNFYVCLGKINDYVRHTET